MAKTSRSSAATQSNGTLSDKDWVTIIGALLRHKSAESQKLAEKLLSRTRHGRQISMLRFIKKKSPTIIEVQKGMKVSRRTVFRYLTALEADGVSVWMDDDCRYHLDSLPAFYKSVV